MSIESKNFKYKILKVYKLNKIYAFFEIYRYISNYGNGDNYQDSEGISQWTDLAKIVCEGVSTGPRPRPVPHKEKKLKIFVGGFDASEDSDPLFRSNVESDEVCINFIIIFIIISLITFSVQNTFNI